ncbi:MULTISPECIES: OmpP1/FadL family transporter [unclassified Duganella]|uniref:OmpP1/FadL family transporter n=1 Tax=unclassified Duganella TaxID=2636909 RepID=UPI000AAFBECB|nr:MULTISPECIES: OmpP1/FadL family transporter [unclassified Duganella]
MNPKYLSLMVAAALSAAAMNANASGYRFGSQSVSGQGTADSNTAEAADASTIFANPAGLSRLEGTQFSGGVTAVVPHSTYDDKGSKRFGNVGSTGGLAHQDDYAPNAVAAPSLYISHKLNDQWAVGLGTFVPYGAKLDYDNNWAGRYALTNIDLKSVTLNPSVSFKLNETHSFGFGIDAEFMKAELGQGVDVPGSIMFLGANAANPAIAARRAALLQAIVAAGGNPAALGAAKDGHATMDGKDWGVGFNLGYMFNLNKDTRFGLAYRSSIHHKLKGDAVWDFSTVTTDAKVNAVLQASSRKSNSPALVDIKTPETLSANVFTQVDDKLALMADLTWSRHSRMDDLHIQFVGTTEGDEVIRQQWKNTVRGSLGMNYKLNDAWLLRAGVAIDESPVRSQTLRHSALPDSDRKQVSFGANWKVSANSSIDLAYSYLKFDDASSNYTNQCSTLAGPGTCTGNGETTIGTWKTHMSLVGVAYNYKF